MASVTTRTLGEKIYDLAGVPQLTDPTSMEEELYGYWRAGARDFVSRAMVNNPEMLNGMISQASGDNNATHVNVTTESINTVMSVLRNDYPCSQISFADSKLYNDSASGSIYEASIYNPVFFIDPATANESRVKVLPTGHTTIKVNYISFTAIDAVEIWTNDNVTPPRVGATGVANLPIFVETALCTYVAIRVINLTIASFIASGDYANAIDKAKSFIQNLQNGGIDIDLEHLLADEDVEIATVALAGAKAELDRAMGSLKEVEQLQIRKNELQRNYFSYFGQSEDKKEDD